jgi:hypothetical protein
MLPGISTEKANFSDLIDRALVGNDLLNFRTFLLQYERSEVAGSRPLSPLEKELVTDAFESFLITPGAMKLGVTEFQGLLERLTAYAAQEEMFSRIDEMRNDCFNALACIKALEARLVRQIAATESLQEALTMQAPPSCQR